MRIKHRTLLRTKELRQLRKKLEKVPNLEHKAIRESPSSKVQVERVVLDNKSELYFVGGELWLVIQQDLIYPGLPALLSEHVQLPKVIVDMGAVSHIANGADVMAPGIFDLDKSVVEGSLVVVIDQKNLMPLAVGRMLLSAETILETNKGRAIDTLHYVGDPLWKLAKELSE
jgi:PUA-domain protein